MSFSCQNLEQDDEFFDRSNFGRCIDVAKINQCENLQMNIFTGKNFLIYSIPSNIDTYPVGSGVD